MALNDYTEDQIILALKEAKRRLDNYDAMLLKQKMQERVLVAAKRFCYESSRFEKDNIFQLELKVSVDEYEKYHGKI